MTGVHLKSIHTLNKPAATSLQVCLSTHDPPMDTSPNRIKNNSVLLRKNLFAISNRKTKTSELLLLLIKHIKIMKLFVIESYQVCTSFKISMLYYSANR